MMAAPYGPLQVMPQALASAVGPSDWSAVKDYFLVQVGSLLTPPTRRLAIQAQSVDVETA